MVDVRALVRGTMELGCTIHNRVEYRTFHQPDSGRLVLQGASLIRHLAQLHQGVRARHQLSDGRGHEDELTLHDGCQLSLRLHEKLEVDETRSIT